MRIVPSLLVAAVACALPGVEAMVPLSALPSETVLVLVGRHDAVLRLDDGAEGWSVETGLAVARPGDGGVRGVAVVPATEGQALRLVPIAIPAAVLAAHADAAGVATARNAALRELAHRDLPGAAWFRHRLGSSAGASSWRRDRAELMDLVGGSRALAENLQLDRRLEVVEGVPGAPATAAAQRTGDLPGIAVRAFDWTPLIKDLAKPKDPLAAAIPADQHALLCADFHALAELAQRLDAAGTPILHAIEPHAEDAGVLARYQRQLGLELSELGRRFGPQVVEAVAITGGDPWLRLGSDVAVVFKARQGALLTAWVGARHAQAVATGAAVARQGRAGTHPWSGVASTDRTTSSYLMPLPGGLLVVANSTVQLDRLAAVADGRAAALRDEPEFTFFRHRYPARAGTSLLVLSDATIRRWCGPRARIADSRRLRAAAALAEIACLDVDGVRRPALPAWLGTVDATGTSTVYGRLGFLTPAAELDLEEATAAEATAYARWREGYQRNWSRVFDPIAVELRPDPQGGLASDLTVLPLIAGSEYGPFIELTRGARIAAGSGDPHAGELARAAIAIDLAGRWGREAGGTLGRLSTSFGADPLAWVGSSVHLYADADPMWAELMDKGDIWRAAAGRWERLPLALHIEVRDGLRLTAFLIALRALAEQSTPGMTTWETITRDGRSYVRIGLAQTGAGLPGGIYYAATPRALVVSANEAMVQRFLARQAAGPVGVPIAWPGDHLVVQVAEGGDLVRWFAQAERLGERERERSWAALPILDEWRRLFPGEDPVAVHERMFGVRLVCPGGGAYVWDEATRSMASTRYGNPLAPRPAPALPAALARLKRLSAGLTWEHDGLRARLELRLRP